jgi:hypothetical protein
MTFPLRPDGSFPTPRFPALLLTLALALGASAIAEAPPRQISELAWMAGNWSGTKDGVASEEHWTSPAGGGLVGMHKDVRDGRMVGFEFLRVAVDPAGKVCYFASPGGAPPTPFCAVEIGDRRVVFENRQHDFPQRILYWLDDTGKLHARIEGPLRGEEATEEWVWSRSTL